MSPHGSRRLRQRRKALVPCLGVRGLVRLLIEQPLASSAAKQRLGALDIRDLAVVVPEIELGHPDQACRFQSLSGLTAQRP